VHRGHGHRIPQGNHAHDERALLCKHTAEAVDTLVWDSNCGINLANYLTNRKEKVAVIAKGCDSRNIVTHIIENKIKREQVYIIGVPCTGMIDKRKITGMVKPVK
jgi:formate dehydrogenase subunit beta